ncbi:MAG TPA: PadR family transcriptional regulator [Longimicrobiaceae bacterium]|nr:PadR family transcriptional regulator [Longimicrobiaceae bacterium]
MPERDLEMLRGTLDVLILKTLSWGPAHGYAEASWIEQVTDDALRVEEGSLYPALHRLEKRGWIESEWGLSENNRRARYYRLTDEGQRQLRAEASTWARFADAVGKVLESTEQPAWARSA